MDTGQKTESIKDLSDRISRSDIRRLDGLGALRRRLSQGPHASSGVAARCTLFSILLLTLSFEQLRAMAADLAGNVQGAGLPIAGSTVTLYAASTGAPTQLAQGKTDDNGAFNLNVGQTPADTVLYLIAKGGTPKAAADKGPN